MELEPVQTREKVEINKKIVGRVDYYFLRIIYLLVILWILFHPNGIINDFTTDPIMLIIELGLAILLWIVIFEIDKRVLLSNTLHIIYDENMNEVAKVIFPHKKNTIQRVESEVLKRKGDE